MNNHKDRAELFEVLKTIKKHVLMINRLYHTKGLNAGARLVYQQNEIQLIWATIHNYRVKHEAKDNDLFYPILHKIAGMSTVVRDQYVHMKNVSTGEIEKEAVTNFMVLRKFVNQLEQMIVKQYFYWDTGTVSKWVMPIKKAAIQCKKSEITIRRHIKAKKIRAYLLAKQWWVPVEELATLIIEPLKNESEENEGGNEHVEAEGINS